MLAVQSILLVTVISTPLVMLSNTKETNSASGWEESCVRKKSLLSRGWSSGSMAAGGRMLPSTLEALVRSTTGDIAQLIVESAAD
jgi:hypothetical protein